MHVFRIWGVACAALVLLAGCEEKPPSLNNSLIRSSVFENSTASVFATPSLTFHQPLHEGAPSEQALPGGARIRGAISSMRLMAQGQELAGSVTWLEEGMVAVFVPSALLPADSQITVETQLTYEVEQEGKWVPATFRGEPFEQRTFSFRTVSQRAENERILPTLSPTHGQTDVSPAVDIVATVPFSLYRERELGHSLLPLRAELEDLALYQEATRLAGRFDTGEVPGRQRKLEPDALLAPGQPHRAVAKVRWARKVENAWLPLEGSTETVETSFTTAGYDPLAGVHADNIATAWPLPRQLHFHLGEHTQGHLRVKRRQDGVLAGLEGTPLVARFSRPSGTVASLPVTYAPGTRTFHFALPEGLQPATLYVLQLVALPQGGAERLLFKAPFRTSRYATFGEKWDAIAAGNAIYFREPRSAGIVTLNAFFSQIPEGFDAFETQRRDGLIQGEAVWQGNSWYEQTAYPLVYRELLAGNSKLKLTWDRPPDVGLPPIHDVYLERRARVLTDAEAEADAVEVDRHAEVVHDMAEVIIDDHNDLLQQAVKHPERETDPWIRQLATSPRPFYSFGTTYRVKLRYQIQGQEAPVTERFVDIHIQ